MSNLVLRAAKGSPLTSAEGDANVTLLQSLAEADGLDVRRFVSGAGTTVTDAAFVSAIDAMPASGGALITPAGVSYSLNNPIALSKSVGLGGPGFGKASMYRTQKPVNLVVTHAGPAFTVQHSATRLHDFHLEYAGTQTSSTTASKGIVIDIQEVVPAFQAQYPKLPSSYAINSVSTANFSTGIHQVNGAEGQISWCDIHTFAQYGLVLESQLLHDLGDMSVHGCNIYSEKYSSIAGILQRSGGGAKFTSNKLNQRGGKLMQYGYYGQLDGATSILHFVNNSLENIGSISIKIVPGTAVFEMVLIACNEFANYAFAGYTPLGYIDLASVHGSVISDNIVRKAGTTDKGIKLDANCTDYYIGGHSFFEYTSITDAVQVATGATPSLQFTGATTTPPPTSNETTFTDTFPPPSGNGFQRWVNGSQGGGTITVNNGLTMQPGLGGMGTEDNRAQYTTVKTYDVRGKSIVLNIDSIGNSADTAAPGLFVSVGIGLRVSGNNVAMAVQGNTLYAQLGDASAFQQAPYSATAMKYWRFRFTTTNYFLEYSADNATYTTLMTGASPGDMSAAKVILFTSQDSAANLQPPAKIVSVALN